MGINFSDAINFLTEITGKTHSSVSNITEEAKTYLSDLTEKEERIREVTIQAIDSVSQTTKQAQTSLIETTHHAINNVQQVSGTIDLVNKTAEQAKLSLEGIDKLKSVSGATTEAIQKAIDRRTVAELIASSIHTWLNSHPIIHWSVNHLLITLGIVLVLIVLIISLFQAIALLFQQAWLFLFKSPLSFGKLIISLPNSFGNKLTQQSDIAQNSLESEAKIESLMNKLEEIKQQQDLILQEIIMLKDSQEVVSK